MKAFLLAIVASVVIAIGANQILNSIGFSSAAAGTSTLNVRTSE